MVDILKGGAALPPTVETVGFRAAVLYAKA